MRDFKKQIYIKAYRLLEQSTPLTSDCGLLCNKACCQGEDEELGMYLFPGEELVVNNYDFNIKTTDFFLKNGKPVLLAICNGKCDRKFRPLSCRIFPLTPYLTYNQIISVELDIRAAGICPLLKGAKAPAINQTFISTVRKVCRMLTEDPEILDFIDKLSRILDEYAQLPDLF